MILVFTSLVGGLVQVQHGVVVQMTSWLPLVETFDSLIEKIGLCLT